MGTMILSEPISWPLHAFVARLYRLVRHLDLLSAGVGQGCVFTMLRGLFVGRTGARHLRRILCQSAKHQSREADNALQLGGNSSNGRRHHDRNGRLSRRQQGAYAVMRW